MPKAIIIYGSTTGNTEILAGYVADGMEQVGVDTTVKDVVDTDVTELPNYDIIALGSSTWGDGELQDDFIPFYDDLMSISLQGKSAGAFGPGDSSYEMFCEAVNLLEARLRECGATIMQPGLKIDGDVELAEEDAISWGRQLASVAISSGR